MHVLSGTEVPDGFLLCNNIHVIQQIIITPECAGHCWNGAQAACLTGSLSPASPGLAQDSLPSHSLPLACYVLSQGLVVYHWDLA